MKGFFFRIAFLSILLTLLWACNHNKEDKIGSRIARKDFIAILADIHIAQAAITSNDFRETYPNYDSIDIVEAVVNAHDYSKASFDTTIAYYTHHADKYLLVYEAVIKELNKKQNGLLDQKRDTTHTHNAPR